MHNTSRTALAVLAAVALFAGTAGATTIGPGTPGCSTDTVSLSSYIALGSGGCSVGPTRIFNFGFAGAALAGTPADHGASRPESAGIAASVPASSTVAASSAGIP